MSEPNERDREIWGNILRGTGRAGLAIIAAYREEIESRLTPSATGQDEAVGGWMKSDLAGVSKSEARLQFEATEEILRIVGSDMHAASIGSVVAHALAALRSRQPSMAADENRTMHDNEQCRNYECPHFDADCPQNCGGATADNGPAAEFCIKWREPAARPSSTQGEDDEIGGTVEAVLREYAKLTGCNPDTYEPLLDLKALRARLASADASARELREALEKIEKHYGSPGIIRTWARAALERKEG